MEQIIAEMRKEAKDLREDTLVSMVEGVYNSIIADYLDKYAKKIENATRL